MCVAAGRGSSQETDEGSHSAPKPHFAPSSEPHFTPPRSSCIPARHQPTAGLPPSASSRLPLPSRTFRLLPVRLRHRQPPPGGTPPPQHQRRMSLQPPAVQLRGPWRFTVVAPPNPTAAMHLTVLPQPRPHVLPRRRRPPSSSTTSLAWTLTSEQRGNPHLVMALVGNKVDLENKGKAGALRRRCRSPSPPPCFWWFLCISHARPRLLVLPWTAYDSDIAGKLLDRPAAAVVDRQVGRARSDQEEQ